MRYSACFLMLLAIPAALAGAGTGLAQTPPDTSAAQPATSAEAGTSEASSLFEKKCYSCHTIGGGVKKGPDLKNISARRSRDWLLEFIPSPMTMMKRGDQTAVQLFKEYAPEVMTDQDLTPEQVAILLDFIDQLSRDNKPYVPAGARLSRATTPEDIPLGRDLFTGRTAFSSGTPACLMCHAVSGTGLLGGGLLGPDLTQANVKFTIPELINILQVPNFPTMSLFMKENDITNEEIVQLIAFFQDAKTRQPDGQSKSLSLLYWALGFAIALLLVAGWIWKDRFIAVRKPLVAGKGYTPVKQRYTASSLLSHRTGPAEKIPQDS